MRTAEDKLKGILPYAAKRAIKIKLKKKSEGNTLCLSRELLFTLQKRFKMLQKKTI